MDTNRFHSCAVYGQQLWPLTLETSTSDLKQTQIHVYIFQCCTQYTEYSVQFHAMLILWDLHTVDSNEQLFEYTFQWDTTDRKIACYLPVCYAVQCTPDCTTVTYLFPMLNTLQYSWASSPLATVRFCTRKNSSKLYCKTKQMSLWFRNFLTALCPALSEDRRTQVSLLFSEEAEYSAEATFLVNQTME